MARVEHDWEAIEKEYRAGQLSNREIARKFNITEGAIRKQAKILGWQKDLVEQVRKAVRNKLVRTEVRKTDANDKEIIESAAERGAQVVVCHRNDIVKHRNIVGLLADQLNEAAENRNEIEEAISDETKDDGNAQRRNQMFKAVSLPSHAGVLRDLSVAMKNLIPLERQAFNLDDGGVSLEEVLNALPREFGEAVRKALADGISET